jgi:Tol biopolymer transport system component
MRNKERGLSRIRQLGLFGIAGTFALLSVAHAADRVESLTGKITFSSDRSGSWRIWLVNADGSELRQVSQSTADDNDVDPSFSNDGKTILFSSTRGGKIGVWTIPAAGGEPKRVCDGDQAEYSPDGGKIALRRENRIWLRDLSSGKEEAVSPKDWPTCSGPAWKPDGKTLAFAARWDKGNGIYLMPVAGGAPTKVYDEKGACEPHFTPDGALIVYETETNICTIQSDGAKNRTITFQAGIQRYGRTSPDGQHIVYCQGVSEKGPWALYTVSIKGGYPKKLIDGGSDLNPDWK